MNICRLTFTQSETFNIHSYLSFARAATSIIFVATDICHDKTFVATNKQKFVATKDVFCRDKHMFVATKLLSRQK